MSLSNKEDASCCSRTLFDAYVSKHQSSGIHLFGFGSDRHGAGRLKQLCFPDESFDVVFASHVLEHILDDRKAMREVHRVLKPKGWAILQVPIGADVTYEDAAIVDPDDRERIFGQWNHVRIYGEDYYDRLEESGFTVRRKNIPAQTNPSSARKFGLNPSHEIAFCTKE